MEKTANGYSSTDQFFFIGTAHPGGPTNYEKVFFMWTTTPTYIHRAEAGPGAGEHGVVYRVVERIPSLIVFG